MLILPDLLCIDSNCRDVVNNTTVIMLFVIKLILWFATQNTVLLFLLNNLTNIWVNKYYSSSTKNSLVCWSLQFYFCQSDDCIGQHICYIMTMWSLVGTKFIEIELYIFKVI